MRGDASDGLPGVKGVGEKTAASLLASHGDLAGIRAAAEAGEGMSAGVRTKFAAAADYLDVAPRVVAVATDLDLGDVDATLPRPDDAAIERATEFAARWSLGSSMERVLAALARG
jgi:5'-3' exonuclease